MTLRFLIDARLPPGLTARLREAGFVAVHVREIRLGDADDLAIWRNALATADALITKDAWRICEPALPEIAMALKSGERIIEIR